MEHLTSNNSLFVLCMVICSGMDCGYWERIGVFTVFIVYVYY